MSSLNVAHVCFSDLSGGASRAAYRIHRCILDHGEDQGITSQMRVVSKLSSDPTVFNDFSLVRRNPVKKRVQDRIQKALLQGFQTCNPTLHSMAWHQTGLAETLHKLRTKKQTNLLHLHWLGDYTLTIEEIGKLPHPLIWTLHDQWAFCGAEHYVNPPQPGEVASMDERYANNYLPVSRLAHESGPDLNRRTWLRKRRSWRRSIQIICPSNWLADCVSKSSLMAHWPVKVIPNPIDLGVWRPTLMREARESLGLPTDCLLVLFGADNGIADPRKGGDLLIKALNHLRNQLIYNQAIKIELLIYGQKAPDKPPKLGFPIHFMGCIHDDHKLQQLYAAADVFVIPSRQDNLPNTGLEAHACGTPVVAFRTGGLVDIVADRITGALADPFDPTSLAASIRWVLEDPLRLRQLGAAARTRAESLWAPARIATLYAEVYRHALSDAEAT